MLDAYIIEEIKKREIERRRREEESRPSLEIEVPMPRRPPRPDPTRDEVPREDEREDDGAIRISFV